MNACRFTLIAALIIISGCSSKHHQAESFVRQGIQNARKGDLDEAMDDFDQAIVLDPQNVDAYYCRGSVKSRLENWDGAIADFTRNIELNPKSADAYFYRGLARNEKGDLDGAIADDNQAIALDSRNVKAYYSRGYGKARKGDLDGAIADYSRAIEIDPKGAQYFGSRAFAKAGKGDWVGAMADDSQAIVLDPQLAPAYIHRGLVKFEEGDPDGAIADYTQAIGIEPKCADARFAPVYNVRGNLKFDQGDLNGAIADFDQAIKLAPQDAGTYMDRGIANYLNNHASAAIADLQKTAELHFLYTDYPRIFIWLVKAGQTDQLAAANQELRDYLLTRAGGAYDWPLQVVHFLIGELSQADFLKAANSGDAKKDRQQHCEAYFYIAINHLLAGDVPAAKSFFQQCIATDAKTFYEYRMAQVKLTALEGKK
jgi:lipoprotein NlpI